ncbi:hypothetical protein ELS79_10335 [Bifidobacterium longum subsp. longum]|nr:hypothetical protein B5U78_10805 [Bifidobacterium longum]RUR43112.1 hypothetical protein ELS79_10335 [Bifidobacterium longum subsp. longum]
MFPATVFVSAASGHLTLLAVGQVLQRSLEPAECAGMPCLICAPFVPVLWLLSTIIFPSLGPSLSRKFYGDGMTA